MKATKATRVAWSAVLMNGLPATPAAAMEASASGGVSTASVA